MNDKSSFSSCVFPSVFPFKERVEKSPPPAEISGPSWENSCHGFFRIRFPFWSSFSILNAFRARFVLRSNIASKGSKGHPYGGQAADWSDLSIFSVGVDESEALLFDEHWEFASAPQELSSMEQTTPTAKTSNMKLKINDIASLFDTGMVCR